MTAIRKLYRFRVATAGATTVDGNVDWSETTRIALVGEIGGQNIQPLQGRTSARPWTVGLVDEGGAVVARIADSGGRAQLLRRLADFAVSTDDGSSWTVKATARIDDIRISGGSVSRVDFTMQDERLIERTTTIFRSGNTTRLSPPGLQSAWLDYQPAQVMAWQVTDVDSGASTTRYAIHSIQRPPPDPEQELFAFEPPEDFVRLLEEDVVDNPAAGQGNFQTLRFNVNGVDREVELWGDSPEIDPVKALRETGKVTFVTVADYEDPDWPVKSFRQCYFHMQSKDPSPDLPLHLGGQDGIDPFTLVKGIYDGDYQDAVNPAVVRYDVGDFRCA